MEKVLNEQGLTHLWSKIEDKIAAGGEGSSNPTAANVSFDNTGTGLQATNVQAALAEINTDLIGSEEVQGMIKENLDLSFFDGFSPTSTRRKKASEISNIANIFTDLTFLRDNSVIIVEWDLDDVTFTGSGFNWVGRLDTNGKYSTIATESYKVTLKKGRYYKMMNFYQTPVDTFYKLAPSMGVGLSYGSGTYPLDNGTAAVPIFKNDIAKVYYPTDSGYVFVLAIWDVTPISSGGLTETEVNTLIDNKLAALNGNEVSY